MDSLLKIMNEMYISYWSQKALKIAVKYYYKVIYKTKIIFIIIIKIKID